MRTVTKRLTQFDHRLFVLVRSTLAEGLDVDCDAPQARVLEAAGFRPRSDQGQIRYT